MRNKWKTHTQTLKQMPEGLRTITICLLFGGTIAIISAFLFGKFDGQISMFELYEIGYGPLMFLGGLFALICGLGLLKRNAWARPSISIFFLASYISEILAPNQCGNTEDIIYTLCILYWLWYFYFKESVRNYFTTEKKNI